MSKEDKKKLDEVWQILKFGSVAPEGWYWAIRSDNGQGVLMLKATPKTQNNRRGKELKGSNNERFY